ncbi:hypothetical protein FGO68_gene4927 [Halteria grandinella]|uniref:Uncharacterized protein n=1 Tax=Halteria grandinella TaxID=5974 RepID=A0A8J8T5K5_HALGN|nr:hypothetical protein FGO68_gene4927 [Halteria grandinella]
MIFLQWIFYLNLSLSGEQSFSLQKIVERRLFCHQIYCRGFKNIYWRSIASQKQYILECSNKLQIDKFLIIDKPIETDSFQIINKRNFINLIVDNIETSALNDNHNRLSSNRLHNFYQKILHSQQDAGQNIGTNNHSKRDKLAYYFEERQMSLMDLELLTGKVDIANKKC